MGRMRIEGAEEGADLKCDMWTAKVNRCPESCGDETEGWTVASN